MKIQLWLGFLITHNTVDGKVVEVNKDLDDTPELLNAKPLDTWIIKVEGKIDPSKLMTEEVYLALDKGH